MSERQAYRVVDDEELAQLTASVVVGIAADPLTGAVLNAGYSWPDRIFAGEKLTAGTKGPYPVQIALMEADMLCVRWGFADVVISMDPQVEWNETWGDLLGS